MDYDFDAEKSDAFIKAAVKRALIDDSQADTLRRESAERSLTPAQVAIEAGIMRPAEAEIAEAFASPKDLAPGYELLDVLGYGALGVVYRARQPHLKRDVAIKAIMQSRLAEQNVLARFQQEGAAIGRLHHPNIVGAFDSGSHRHRLYLVMELVPGTDLRRRIELTGPMKVSTALSIVRQTASGLSHALAQGIVHRDIKPGNLILTEAPSGFDLPEGVPLVKIADFGLARLSSGADEHDATRLTIAGSALGTPMYCAPEQLSGDAVDHRADIYALGATLINMLTGCSPFKETKVSKLITAKLTGQKYSTESLPEGTPAEVMDLVDAMIAHDPDQRIGSYEALISRIDELQGTNVAARPRDTVVPNTTARPGRRAVISVFAVALLIVAAAASYKLLPKWFAPPIPTHQLTAWERPLFDGKSLAPWKTSDGVWKTVVLQKRGNVLAGDGSAWRRIPTPSSAKEGERGLVAVFAGIDLHECETAEIHFGFVGDDVKTVPRFVIQHAGDQVILGMRNGIRGELKILHARAIQSKRAELSNDHYFSVQLHGEHWFAYVDDMDVPFGYAKANPAANNDILQLLAQNGEAYFSDLIVMGLTPRTERE